MISEVEQLRKPSKGDQELWVVLERVGGKGRAWKPIQWGSSEREVREWLAAERAQRKREKDWENRNWKGQSKQPRRELKLALATIRDLKG